MPEQVHFHVALKSLEVAPPQEVPLSDPPYGAGILAKVRPKGDFYFVNPNITLLEDDWIIYGVASTDNVDLQNDIVDAKSVFGDYLEEFINTGKIFYEHGYRFAKDASPSNRIDEPIGYPYMVEIHENKLWIWAVLDKSHPLAQKVWGSLSGGDERFNNQWGFSIGGLMVGQPQYSTSVYGRVRSLPKIRLYEISVTPQPMNPYTWANVVKSFISEDGMSEHKDTVEKKVKTDTVNIEPDDNQEDVVELPDLDKKKSNDGVAGSPTAEVKEGKETVNIKKALDDEELDDKDNDKPTSESNENESEEGKEPEEDNANLEDKEEENKEKDLKDVLEEVAKGEGNGENPQDDTVPDSAEGSEVSESAKPEETDNTTSQEEPKQDAGGTDDDNVLVDLIGGGKESSEENPASENSGDASMELILDEIQAFRDEFEEIKARLEKLLTVEAQEHGNEEIAPEEGPNVSEEVLSKSFNTMEQALDMIEFIRAEVSDQKVMIKSLIEKFESIPVIKPDVEKTVSAAEEALNARNEFSPDNAPIAKSVDSETEISVPTEGTAVDHIMKSLSDSIEDAVSAPAKDKFEAIMRDPELLDVTKALVHSYEEVNTKLSEGKIKASTHRNVMNEILVSAREVLGLSRAEFESLANKG